MAGMKREYNPNKAGVRKRRPIVYIICEGKETEIKYFRHFRTRNCLVDIVPVPSKYTAAEHLVRHARDVVKQAAYYPKDGDQIWCVFDRDDNTDEMLRKASDIAGRAGYGVAFSNPCFEYWYLLHFVNHTAYIKSAEEALHLLRANGRLENYEKNQDVFTDLLAHQEEAISRSKKRLDRLRQDGISLLSRNSNPMTTVHELVEYLTSKSKTDNIL